MKSIARDLLLATLVLIIIWASVDMIVNKRKVRSSTIPTPLAAQCIIGEAEGEGQAGMEAVACALLERGHTNGVYGCTSYRVREKLYSKDIETMAYAAWARAHVDVGHCAALVGYADSWQSRSDIEGPGSLLGKCPATAELGGHVFFDCG